MMPHELIFEYLNQGGFVSYALVMLFFIISYSIGFRISILFKGRKLNVRSLYSVNKLNQTIQSSFLEDIKTLSWNNIKSLNKKIDLCLLDRIGQIQKFASILQTCVLLAPLLGLLGTVIGMIETFSSLSSSNLFSTTGGIAGGISQALLTTQLGLLVAVPGVFMSRYLKKIEKKTYLDMIQIKDLYLQEARGVQ